MSAMHTPGPWVWFNDELHNAAAMEAWKANTRTNYPTAIIETDGGYYGPRDADRDLIAAAPDLLAALKAIVAHYADPGIHGFDIPNAVAAIAKAEGRDQ